MSVLKPLVTAALIASIAAPAWAWGQRERDVLTGMVAATVIGSMVRQNREHPVAPSRPLAPTYARAAYAPVAYAPVAHRAAGDIEARAAFGSFSGQARFAIQNALAQRGYYGGRIDGTWGPGTWAALQGYAADRGARQALRSYDGTMAVFEDLML